jgi:flagellar FlgN protein
LMNADTEGLAAISRREEQIVHRLEHCLDWRVRLLARAAGEGRPAANLRLLAQSLQPAQRLQFSPQLDEASRCARRLQQEALTNWVIAQRTLVHLSQLLEIIATGGRLQPTYGSEAATSSGALLNQVG